jgi:hypothetical protein
MEAFEPAELREKIMGMARNMAAMYGWTTRSRCNAWAPW